MSVDTIRAETEPAENTHPGAIDVTGLPVRELQRTVDATGNAAVHLERVPGRTYLVTRPDR